MNAAVGSDEVVESWLGFTTRKESWSAVYWTALWLNGADGWLARSVASATVLTRAEAFALGGPNARGALVIRIQAPASAMSNAIAQARALLGQLPSSPTAGLPGVERLARSDRGRARRDPRVRLAELIWASPPPPSTSAIRELLLGELAPTRAIVVRSAAPLSGGG